VKTETRVGIFVIISIGIFLYLSLNIGAIRLDQRQYYLYKTYFDDTGGLAERAPVKIAGVEIGWVDSINLMENGKGQVNMMIHKRNKLARNAYATIQQEGLIGTKHIEIDPGDPTTGTLPPGATLAMPGRPATNVSELLDQFKEIASGVQEVVTSFKNTVGTRQGEENLRVALNNVALASQRIANFSQVLERSISRNENNINLMLHDFRKTAFHLQETIPAIRNDFNRVTLALTDDTLPHFSHASQEAEKTFKSAGELTDKLNTGKGTLGKLITSDETYGGIKKTINGIQNMVEKANTVDVLLDMHSESHFKTNDSKGYLEVQLRPESDYFYNIQLVSSEYGRIMKKEVYRKRFDEHGEYMQTDNLDTLYHKMRLADRVEKTTRIKNDILFGFQFGKRFNRVALRIGMFEDSFGAACDFYVPLNTNYFHWITSLEAFDFKGSNRLDSTRPHFKWNNKLFFMRNLYTSFGFDDFCSKNRATPFFGAGLRFGDDDIKYLLSYLPTGQATKK
jgi:ABC-type transport system involved in resistance to organic solvents, periplasmic component